MNSTAAVKFFEANPRATAKEAGITKGEADQLVGAGKILPAGNRKTGKKGRPPVEYVIVGYDLGEDSVAQASVQAAQGRVRIHRHFERLSARMMRAYREFGPLSEEYLEAKAYRTEAFSVTPPLPTGTDWVLAGVTDLPDDEPESAFEVDEVEVKA